MGSDLALPEVALLAADEVVFETQYGGKWFGAVPRLEPVETPLSYTPPL